MGTTYQASSRNFSAQSVTVGSASATSTTAFTVHQIKITSTQNIKYLVAPSVSVSSTTLLQQGVLLPASVIEYVSTQPGEQLAAISFGVTSAVVTVTETCA